MWCHTYDVMTPITLEARVFEPVYKAISLRVIYYITTLCFENVLFQHSRPPSFHFLTHFFLLCPECRPCCLSRLLSYKLRNLFLYVYEMFCKIIAGLLHTGQQPVNTGQMNVQQVSGFIRSSISNMTSNMPSHNFLFIYFFFTFINWEIVCVVWG